jgi:hypothetical protein
MIDRIGFELFLTIATLLFSLPDGMAMKKGETSSKGLLHCRCAASGLASG